MARPFLRTRADLGRGRPRRKTEISAGPSARLHEDNQQTSCPRFSESMVPVSDLSAGRRVLLVLYKLQPGGAERVALSLATSLLDSPYVPLVCALNDGPLADELRRREIPVVILDKSSRADPAPLLRLVRLLKQQNIHIIHTHSFSPNFWRRLASLL